MGKYNLDKAFRLRSKFTLPFCTATILIGDKLAEWAASTLDKDKRVIRVTTSIASTYDEDPKARFKVDIVLPRKRKGKLPCIIDFHGGGFGYDGCPYHYQLAIRYALGTGAVVIMPHYRLVHFHSGPDCLKDGKAVLDWVFANTEDLHIDPDRIGILGDSAGAYIAIHTTYHAVRTGKKLLFQTLLYPTIDPVMRTESMKKYVDTPIWDSKKTKVVWDRFFEKEDPAMLLENRHAYSLLEMEIPDGIPDTYVEAAEYDCMHDEGVMYAELLKERNVKVELHEIKGGIHAFDSIKCAITDRAVEQRLGYMNRYFWEKPV